LKRLHADWRRWRALPGWEQRLLGTAIAWHLPLAVLRLQVLGLQRSITLQQRAARQGADALPAGLHTTAYAQRCAELLAIAARRGVVRANCLPQSLALHALLRRAGLQPVLRLGVVPRSQPLHAHAWVELQGQVLGGSSHAGFRPFPEVTGP